jgi:hypothetical protein
MTGYVLLCAYVQIKRRDDNAIDALRRPASEKRQGNIKRTIAPKSLEFKHPCRVLPAEVASGRSAPAMSMTAQWSFVRSGVRTTPEPDGWHGAAVGQGSG